MIATSFDACATTSQLPLPRRRAHPGPERGVRSCRLRRLHQQGRRARRAHRLPVPRELVGVGASERESDGVARGGPPTDAAGCVHAGSSARLRHRRSDGVRERRLEPVYIMAVLCSAACYQRKTPISPRSSTPGRCCHEQAGQRFDATAPPHGVRDSRSGRRASPPRSGIASSSWSCCWCCGRRGSRSCGRPRSTPSVARSPTRSGSRCTTTCVDPRCSPGLEVLRQLHYLIEEHSKATTASGRRRCSAGWHRVGASTTTGPGSALGGRSSSSSSCSSSAASWGASSRPSPSGRRSLEAPGPDRRGAPVHLPADRSVPVHRSAVRRVVLVPVAGRHRHVHAGRHRDALLAT